MSLHLLVFSEIEDCRKVLFIIFRANGHLLLFCGLFALFGMS